jgi:hypothetical protein
VAHACNFGYLGGGGQPRQNVSKTPSQPIRGVVHTYNTSYTGGIGRRIMVRLAEAKTDLIEK